MEVMLRPEECRQLTGRIEANDAYLGGGRPGGKPGRGSENKVAFVAAVQTTESGRPSSCACRVVRHQEVDPGIRRDFAGRTGHAGHGRTGLLHRRARHGHPA